MKKRQKEICKLAELLVAWHGWNIHLHSRVALRMSGLDPAVPSVRRTDAIVGARPPALPLRARTCVGYGVRQ